MSRTKSNKKAVEVAEETKAVEVVGETEKESKDASDAKETEKDEGLTLSEVYELALRGGEYRRKAWSKNTKSVFIRRGETKLAIGDEKYSKPYQPSQEDAIAKDWYKSK
jgi:predicted proteasome-type protease